jgi:hypothetical protein
MTVDIDDSHIRATVRQHDPGLVTIRAWNAAGGFYATAPRPGTAEREATT